MGGGSKESRDRGAFLFIQGEKEKKEGGEENGQYIRPEEDFVVCL